MNIKAIIPLIATFSTQTHITFVLTQDNYYSILSARGPGKNKSLGIYMGEKSTFCQIEFHNST